MINATVGILTFNSSRNLYQCLKSVENFKEKIILDGGSIDATFRIAKKFNCKILAQNKYYLNKNKKISNFSGLRNQIVHNSKYDLILMLDSDEQLLNSSNQFIDYLSKSIINKNKNYACLAKRIPSLKNISYKMSNLFPEFQPRLIFKPNLKRFVKDVHEMPKPKNLRLNQLKTEKISINFGINFSESKYNFYYQIEKKMLRKSFIKSIQFILYRISVNFKKILKFVFLNKSKGEIKLYEMFIIKNNFKYALKLLFYKINIFDK